MGNIPLITRGQMLSDVYINKMRKLDITGAYIESNIGSDIQVKEFIEPKLKCKTLASIKKVFDEFTEKSEITYFSLNAVSNMAKELVINILAKDEIIINIIELKGYDDYTYRHCLCVAILSISIGIKLGFSTNELVEVATSGLLHDIGKLNIPINILNKPSKLTNEEFEVIKKHPENGYVQLGKQMILSSEELIGVFTHHEKYDGTGYPNGLAGENIHLFGRILAIADVYDAITSDRPYRKACFPNEAIEFMMSHANVHFDYELLLSFLKIVAAYPAGTIVSLSNEQTAIVVKNNEQNTLRPIIRILYQDGTCSKNIDLLTDKKYLNVTIVGMGYDNKDVNYQSMRSDNDNKVTV